MSLTLYVTTHDGTLEQYTDVEVADESGQDLRIEFTDESRKPPLDVAGATVERVEAHA